MCTRRKWESLQLENFVTQKDISWYSRNCPYPLATHGEPCSVNAHPHYFLPKKLALIHNGIIENYAVLIVPPKVTSLKSSTITEVLVQLIEYMKSCQSGRSAYRRSALNEVIGAYAIAILDKEHPEEIIAARKSSPLVVGVGENEFFAPTSRYYSIVEYTDKVVYLEDGEIAVMNRGRS